MHLTEPSDFHFEDDLNKIPPCTNLAALFRYVDEYDSMNAVIDIDKNNGEILYTSNDITNGKLKKLSYNNLRSTKIPVEGDVKVSKHNVDSNHKLRYDPNNMFDIGCRVCNRGLNTNQFNVEQTEFLIGEILNTPCDYINREIYKQ